jgi:uncharacterized circularly permuted ATP-grasp superfamily protein/uncharacterized alpha-E superfamily protein
MLAEKKSPGTSSLTSSYIAPADRYDELLAADGSVRPHWLKFFEQLEALGSDELSRRWEKAKQLLHENGVSYNVYGDPRGVERPWNLSPVPVLLAGTEWEELETGIAQRARLLDAVLHDLYGPQRTLADGLLPPELIFDNPGFLRACHGISVPRARWLPLYAADLVRQRDGRFAVLEDRTQAPSGAGYTLENRIIISSALPEPFRDCQVERLAPFFRALRGMLQALAPHNRDNPRIVVLTPGPHNATYFEQAYLAQYLGYTMVNGGDLTVRDDRVYLKTLGGLAPIDVILRRVHDDYCDPLELRSDSALGVPGLVQAARAGNVAIASPLGTGVLQSPGFLPYLGRLSRALLGEELSLDSVRTCWCGDPEGLAEGLNMLADAVVKPTFAAGYVQPIFTGELSESERQKLRARIEAQPRRYVVQERVAASTTPLLHERTLSPIALTLRSFAVAGRDDYVVMPGGLSRVANAGIGTEMSMQLGAGSKDTWVLSEGPVTSFSLLPPIDRPIALSRGGSDLPSRAADDLYWLGRYAERAEGVARLARVVATRLNEIASQADLERSAEFGPLLAALQAQTSLAYSRESSPGPTDFRTTVGALISSVFDDERRGTLRSTLRSTLRTGRLVRDRISTDTWRVLASLEDEVKATDEVLARDPLGTLHDALNHVIVRLAAFSGLMMESMTRGQAWRFLDMGRRVERAMTLIKLLRSTLCERNDREGPLLEAVLEIADSVMTYRRRYLATLQIAPVVDLLLTDETNPRSVVYQLEALTNHIAALPNTLDGMRTPQQRIALSVLTDLKLADIDRLSVLDEHGQRPKLSALLADLTMRIPALSDSLSDRYLNHATVSRHLTFDEVTEISQQGEDAE